MTIDSVAVLGAGTMGAQIALHAANAGLAVHLLDVDRSTADAGLARARRLSPDPQFTADTARLVTTGGFDTGMDRLAGASWIVEAIVEQADAKRALLARVDAVRQAHAIVSTNTSGLSVASLASELSDGFRRHWLGTHFFNPPRYLHLLELVPTADTDPAVLETISGFADRILGKGVVIARDTPGFIANRLGVYGAAAIIREIEEGRCTIEEADAMTGVALGRPASATFRTLDMAGLDVFAAVLSNLVDKLPGEGAAFALPRLVEGLVTDKRLGEKSGAGFYKRVGNEDGSSTILVVDPGTLDYRPRQPVRLPALDAARTIDDLGARVRMLFTAPGRVGGFLRRTLGPMLLYAAHVAPDIAPSIDDVDRAMRWGFGWELGPFELLDAIGAAAVVGACPPVDVPALVADAIARDGRLRPTRTAPRGAGLLILTGARERDRIVKQNAGASLVDIGDGALCLQFHSKLNTIGGDAVEMMQAGVAEAEAHFEALVIGSEAPHFSAGANLMLVLLEAQDGNWDEIDGMVRAFQDAVQRLRYSAVPVVAAPSGLCLGGGTEIVLHADEVQAGADTYAGLVETGVGLIPAGGGTAEMAARADAAAGADGDLVAFVRRAFETMALARVSTSAADAKRLGYLGARDGITMNRERVIADAKARALALAHRGYHPPAGNPRIRVGGESARALLELGVHHAVKAGRASAHDGLIGRVLARALTGGDLPHAAFVDTHRLLELEREAFLGLVGQPPTLDRIRHTLETGKPLRN